MRRSLNPTDIPTVERIGRDEFIADYWDYRIGEHVSFVADTQMGKTTLAFQLMQLDTRPEGPQGLIFVMKPDDPTVRDWIKPLGYKRIKSWPPPLTHGRLPKVRQPAGWVLWPSLGDIEDDDDILYREFAHALGDSYRAGARKGGARRILFCDEILGMVDLGLKSRLNKIWQQGSGMRLGLWAATQRPFTAPPHMYSAARHLFIAVDQDKRNRDRFREIGGVDPDVIAYYTDPANEQMAIFEFLYINRRDRTIAIIEAD